MVYNGTGRALETSPSGRMMERGWFGWCLWFVGDGRLKGDGLQSLVLLFLYRRNYIILVIVIVVVLQQL